VRQQNPQSLALVEMVKVKRDKLTFSHAISAFEVTTNRLWRYTNLSIIIRIIIM